MSLANTEDHSNREGPTPDRNNTDSQESDDNAPNPLQDTGDVLAEHSADTEGFKDARLPRRIQVDDKLIELISDLLGRAAEPALRLFDYLPFSASREPVNPSPRPALPLPPEIAKRYQVPSVTLLESKQEKIGADVSCTRGKLCIDDKELSFRYFAPSNTSDPAPFILILPPTVVKDPLMDRLCLRMVQAGFASGILQRRNHIFQLNESPQELEQEFRELLTQNRAFLAWIAEQPDIDGKRLSAVGVSLGGIVAGSLAAVEPNLEATVLLLAGGDLADLLANTKFRRIKNWINHYCASEGITHDEFIEQVKQELVSDPLPLAKYVDTEKILMITATKDKIIPLKNATLLAEAFGGCEKLLIPLSHYSSIFMLESIIKEVTDFAGQRLDKARD